MRKQTLSEELNRIKGMMNSINENEFDAPEQQGPSEDIKNQIIAFEQAILQNNEIWEESEIDLNEGFIEFVNDEEQYLKFSFDIDIEAWPWFEAGRNWDSNGDPGYPDEGEGLMWGFGGVELKFYTAQQVDGQWNEDIVYEGPDFTNFFKQKYAGGKTVETTLFNYYDQHMNELAENR
jgi:hypothetical protein